LLLTDAGPDGPTDDELRLLTEVALEAEEQSLPPEQIEARLRDTRLWQLLVVLAKNDVRILAYVMALLMIIQVVNDLRSKPEPLPAPQVTVNVTVPTDEIVTEIEKRLEQDCQIPESTPMPPKQAP
jgi:hypothetical protein